MTRTEIQSHALALPESDRATLAAELLSSLPALLVDPDDGVVEAQCRSQQLDDHRESGQTWAEVKRGLGR